MSFNTHCERMPSYPAMSLAIGSLRKNKGGNSGICHVCTSIRWIDAQSHICPLLCSFAIHSTPRRVSVCLQSLHGHQSPVECVTFDGAEEYVVAGAAGGTIKVWDLEAAKVTRTFTGHRSNCVAVDFHPFGDFFASGSLDTNLKVWDTRRKGCIHTYKGHTRGITHIRFSPDGRWVLSGSEDSTVKLWDLTAGKMLKEFRAHTAAITAVEFHPNEFFMATSAADRTTRFWDLESFEEAGVCPAEVSSTRAMCFRGDGAVVYTAHQDSLKVWGWEPVRGYDIVDVSWAKVADINIHENKLLGAGFHQSFVGIWVIDLEQVLPRPDDDLMGSAVAGLESSMPANGGAIDAGSLRAPHHADGGGDVNVSMSRSFRRSMLVDPSATSQPKMYSQKKEAAGGSEEDNDDDDDDDDDDDADEYALPSPSVEADAGNGENRYRCRQQRDDTGETTRMDDGALESSSGRQYAEDATRPQFRDASNATASMHQAPADMLDTPEEVEENIQNGDEGDEVENKLAKPSMVSVATVTGNSLRGQPLASLEEIRQQLDATTTTTTTTTTVKARPGTSPAVKKTDAVVVAVTPTAAPNSPEKRDMHRNIGRRGAPHRHAAQHTSSLPSPSSAPPLNIDSFLPSNCGVGTKTADEAVIARLLEPHAKILTILSSRLVNVQLIHGLLWKKDYKGAFTAMLRLGDISVAADVLSVLPSHTGALSLENCPSIVALSEQLLSQRHDTYIRIALDTIQLMVDGYGQLILDNINAPGRQQGVVDLSSEARRQRCEACVSAFRGLQPTLASTALRMDANGERAGILSARVDTLCK